MSAVSQSDFRQQYFDFGLSDYYQTLHGQHNDYVAVCSSPSASEKHYWNQDLYLSKDALYAELEIIRDHDVNAYHSQNGFNTADTRLASNIKTLTSFYVDMDVYNIPGLENITADGLLDLVLDKFPWLPCPTSVIYSGRGYYLNWIFNKPIGRDLLPQWGAVMGVLVPLLKQFGADQACTDAPRVLRIPDSVNQKSGEVVSCYVRKGETVSFGKLKSLILNNGVPVIEAEREKQAQILAEKQPQLIPDHRPKRTTKSVIRQCSRVYQLAFDRMNDCIKLAELRGSPGMVDHRERLLFVYAVSGVYYWPDIEQAKAELDQFCLQHFGKNKYSHKRVGTVLNKLKQHRDGVSMIYKGKGKDIRYSLTNAYIIDLLGITLDEQQQLKTLISKPVKAARLTAKRRAKGIVSRAEYIETNKAKASKDRELIKALRRRFMSYGEIGKELGISPSQVSKLDKQ